MILPPAMTKRLEEILNDKFISRNEAAKDIGISYPTIVKAFKGESISMISARRIKLYIEKHIKE